MKRSVRHFPPIAKASISIAMRDKKFLRAIKINKANGFALVVVLAILVLVVGLAVGFLARVSTQRATVNGYQTSAVSRQFADTAVSLVQGQINMASTQGSNVAWTSQPGMARTFDTSGNLLSAYKLYSAADMVSTSVGVTNGAAQDAAPADWAASPAIWSDLNAPVTGENGVQNFPIVDPSVADGTTIPGYSLASPPGATTNQPAPMPVRWLYVLRQGQIVTPSPGTGSTATDFSPVKPTKDNPIVGRMAFWTDDETCKVNVNTASEGTYWDVPRCFTDQERKMAVYQPANKEFQRYPGHPAMTSLSAVLPGLTLQNYLDLTPRYKYGGSQGATAIPQGAVSLNSTTRLYPSLDELIFNPDRTTSTVLDRPTLEARRFLLTAQSRAPETNLYNLPRVATWPIYKLSANSLAGLDPARTTAFDRLIAFCSSTGGVGTSTLNPFFFQRESADSATNDMSLSRNTQLYSYLQALTGKTIPGFGGNFSQKYPRDRDQILTEIFDYVRCTDLYDDYLADGNQFTSFRGVNTVNPGFGWVTPARSVNGTQGMGRFFTVSEMGLVFICNAAPNNPATATVDESMGSNDPSTNPTLGGTMLLPNTKRIQALFVPEMFCPMQGWVPLGQNMKVEVSGLDAFKINGTSLGLPATGTINLNYYINAIGQGKLWGGNPHWKMALCKQPYALLGTSITISTLTPSMAFTGGNLTVRLLTQSGVEVQKLQVRFPDSTNGFPIPNLVSTGSTAVVSGASATTKENWWTFNQTISTGSSTGRLYRVAETPSTVDPTNANPGAITGGEFLRAEDVVRSIVLRHGDFRLVAAQPNLDDRGGSIFIPHPNYQSTTVRLADDFSTSSDQKFVLRDLNVTMGKYIDSLTYCQSTQPDIPSSVGAENATSTGDYDTGAGTCLDGPYCNKPDEGNILGINSGAYPYFDANWQQQAAGPTFFSPNRQIPSAVMFGSLPTGASSNKPWQTLLFRPLSGAESTHIGATDPKDSLLLDLFWMPVVEPYAISDRFSTAGKINMNYQILPFTSIKRSSGLYAVLKAEKVAAYPNAVIGQQNRNGASIYKANTSANLTLSFFSSEGRIPVDVAATLGQFDSKFQTGGAFRSPSEICGLYVVPRGQTVAGMPAFWDANRVTGDNVREKLYASIYPRLTTKSNTFTVHFRTQALRQVPASNPEIWTEGRDQITGEYRGSTTIERFIDANNPNIPDYAASGANVFSQATLDTFYRWRTIGNRQFSP